MPIRRVHMRDQAEPLMGLKPPVGERFYIGLRWGFFFTILLYLGVGALYSVL